MHYKKKGRVFMWTVVYMAQSKDIATKLQDLLSQDGILVKIRPISKNHENNDNYYEVLVPEAEVEEAHSVIIEKGF
jgi:menaquinone-dependent protoporphyrinogen IX oxidase